MKLLAMQLQVPIELLNIFDKKQKLTDISTAKQNIFPHLNAI